MLAAVRDAVTRAPGFTCRPARAGLAILGADGTLVVAKVHVLRDQRAVVLLAWVCHESAADPRAMLRLAAGLGAGAVALDGSAYVVRYAIPAAQLATVDLVPIVTALGVAARDLGTRLEANRVAATDASLAMFAHLAA